MKCFCDSVAIPFLGQIHALLFFSKNVDNCSRQQAKHPIILLLWLLDKARSLLFQKCLKI